MKKRKRYMYKVVRQISKASAFASGSYSLEYKTGTIVEAKPGTLGIFVFNRRKDAERWIESCISGRSWRGIIKRVIPIGRGKKVKKISRSQNGSAIWQFYKYKDHKDLRWIQPPPGTMVYPAVEVVD